MGKKVGWGWRLPKEVCAGGEEGERWEGGRNGLGSPNAWHRRLPNFKQSLLRELGNQNMCASATTKATRTKCCFITCLLFSLVWRFLVHSATVAQLQTPPAAVASKNAEKHLILYIQIIISLGQGCENYDVPHFLGQRQLSA